jgi:hypothetical protein
VNSALELVVEIVRLVPRLGDISEAVARAIWGGDLEVVKELTKHLPTSTQMEALAAATKAEERRRAEELFRGGNVEPVTAEHGD